MKNHTIYLLMISIFLVHACEKDNGQHSQEAQEQVQESPELTQNFNLLNWSPNVYHKYFAAADKEFGISSLKETSFSEETIMSYENPGLTAKSGLVYKVNGKALSTSKNGLDLAGLYGTDVRFTIEKEGREAFKDGTTSKEVDMYIPHLVTLKKPEIRNNDELFPHCYAKDLVLEWNADPKNKEGLIVAAEYVGMSANPNRDKAEHIINTDFIAEDDGSWVIGDDLWSGIPDTGIVHLILLRGNVDLTEIDGELNKFFAETHAVASIILIRDLETVIK